MNILFYVYVNPKVRGGIERLIAELSSAATLQGHKVFILADCETGTDFPYPLHENVTIICKKSALEKKYSQFITQICADQHIDIAVIMRTGSWIHQIFAQALAYTQTRVILSEHAAPEIATKEFPNRSRLIALHSVDGVHLLLDDYKKSVAQELHDKVWVIPNFIETDLHYTTPYEDRHTKKIIMVGRLTAIQKRPMILLKAFHQLKEKYPDWQLVFLGSGSEQEKMQTYIHQHNLEESVHIKGQVTDVFAALNQAEIFCLPSAYEGLPISLLEAMSCGLPAVVFEKSPGNNNVVIPSETGLLADGLECPTSLSNALETLIASRDLRIEYSKATLKEVKKYSKQHIIAIWLLSLEEMMKTPKIINNISQSSQETYEDAVHYLFKHNLIAKKR